MTSLRDRLLRALAIPIALGLLFSAALFVRIALIRADEREDQRRRAVITGANVVLRLAIDAETGERGFALTGDPSFLEPYEHAEWSLGHELEVLEASLRTPAQRALLARIDELLQTWRRELGQPVIAARRNAPIRLADRAAAAEAAANAARAADLGLQLRPTEDRREARHEALTKLGADLDEAVVAAEALAAPWRDARALAGARALALDQGSSEAEELGIELVSTVSTLAATARANESAVSRLIVRGVGKEITDQIRELAEQLVGPAGSGAARRPVVREAVTWGRVLTALSPLLVAVLCALLGRRLIGELTRRLEPLAETARGLGAGDLSLRAPVGSLDEVGVVALAMNNLAARLDVRIRDISAISQLSELLHACRSTDEALEVIRRLLPPLFPRSSGAVYLTPATGGRELTRATHWGEPEATLSFLLESCWALRQGRGYGAGWSETAAAGAAPPPCAHLDGASPSAWRCMPLAAHGETLGMLHLREDSSPTSAAGPHRNTAVIEAIADQLSLALSNLRLEAKLREQSIRDPLTGLYNRRYVNEILERELARIRRVGSSLAIMMFDVDHFKRLNDTLGHDAGDRVLRELGAELRATFRASDVASRWGGEEFVVVLPDSTLDKAAERAERLRVAIVGLESRFTTPVTVSIGVAAAPPLEPDSTQLLEAADQALYAAKRAGRNQVVAAGVATNP